MSHNPSSRKRDLTMADLLDTLRWIAEKDGAIPAKGSERERRFIDLWTRRLIVEEGHRFDVVIRDDGYMRLLGCSVRHDDNQCAEVYQWDW